MQPVRQKRCQKIKKDIYATVPRLDGLVSNSNAVLSLSYNNLPEKVQGSLESILLLVTSLECGSTEK
jgi:hypothetical protein